MEYLWRIASRKGTAPPSLAESSEGKLGQWPWLTSNKCKEALYTGTITFACPLSMQKFSAIRPVVRRLFQKQKLLEGWHQLSPARVWDWGGGINPLPPGVRVKVINLIRVWIFFSSPAPAISPSWHALRRKRFAPLLIHPLIAKELRNEDERKAVMLWIQPYPIGLP